MAPRKAMVHNAQSYVRFNSYRIEPTGFTGCGILLTAPRAQMIRIKNARRSGTKRTKFSTVERPSRSFASQLDHRSIPKIYYVTTLLLQPYNIARVKCTL